MTSDGVALPVWADATALRFFAPISPTRYMSETVFWLEQADQPDQTIGAQEPTAAGTLAIADRYTATLRLEENQTYSPQVVEGDHWFWLQLPAPITKTFALTTSALVPGPAQVRINVWGSTEAPADPDHAYRLTLNDQPLGEFPWDGHGQHTIEAAIPAGVLRDGPNVLSVSAPGLPEVPADITYLNWIALDYPRAFAAQDDRLMFESRGRTTSIDGFLRPDRCLRRHAARSDYAHPRAAPMARLSATAGRRYWAVGPQGYQAGRWQAAQLTPDLRAVDNAARLSRHRPDDLLDPLTAACWSGGRRRG